jgi:ribosomal protein L20
MKNINSKTSSEKLIEQLIDLAPKYSTKRIEGLKSEALGGVMAMLEILVRLDNTTMEQQRLIEKVKKQKPNYTDRLNRIRELRAQNMHINEIGDQLRSEGYTISNSLISTLLVRNRNISDIQIPDSFNLGQAITYLRGNGLTFGKIVEHLNKAGYRTHKKALLTENTIYFYFHLPKKERNLDYRYDVQKPKSIPYYEKENQAHLSE